MQPTNEQQVLLIEDDEPKLRSVVNFLLETIPDINLVTAASLTSAIRVLSNHPITLAIIDMSLPTYDVAKDRDGGGQPQGFGGVDILKFIATESPSTFSVVLTQYEEFTAEPHGERKDLPALRSELHKKFGTQFLGVIYYSGQLGEWRDDLLIAMTKAGIRTRHENTNS